MKLKIVSDGTPSGTKLVTETGEVIEGVLLVSWSMSTDEDAVVMAELQRVPCEIVTEFRHIEIAPMAVVPKDLKVEDSDWAWADGELADIFKNFKSKE